MGAEGWQVFASVEARRWLDDLVDEGDIFFVQNTLEILVDFPPGERPDVCELFCALAAAEMVAAAGGMPPQNFPPRAQQWIETYGLEADPEMTELACRALKRIDKSSESADAPAQQPAEWVEALADLRRRLKCA